MRYGMMATGVGRWQALAPVCGDQPFVNPMAADGVAGRSGGSGRACSLAWSGGRLTQHLSQGAYDRLQGRARATSPPAGRIEIARKIETARELGDLSENGDYHAAKDEQGKMEGRIRHLEPLLENAEIVEAADGDTVGAGSIVTHPLRGRRRRPSATSSATSRSATTTST